MKKVLITTAFLIMCNAMPVFAKDMDKDMQIMCEKKFEMMDTNKDGMITMAEHESGAKTMFTNADTDKDGMVSKDEHMAMMKKDMMTDMPKIMAK